MSSVEHFWRQMAATQGWSAQAVALLSAIADTRRTPQVPAHVRALASRLVRKFPAPTVYPPVSETVHRCVEAIETEERACNRYRRPQGVMGGPCLNCGCSQPEHATGY